MQGLRGKPCALSCAQGDATNARCGALDLELRATGEYHQELLPIVRGMPGHHLVSLEDHRARAQPVRGERHQPTCPPVRPNANQPSARNFGFWILDFPLICGSFFPFNPKSDITFCDHLPRFKALVISFLTAGQYSSTLRGITAY